jgi:hypothetical protein
MLGKWNNSFCWLVLMIGLAGSVEGQSVFRDATELYLGENVFRSSLAVGINDMNGDEVDDLIVMDEGRSLRVLINQGPGQKMELIEYGPKVSATAEWSFAIGDLDNDDIPEIVTTGVYNSVKVFQFYPVRKSIVRIQRVSSGSYGQGSNIIDIDLDGNNDYFLCHDEGESRVFMNNGSGRIILNEGLIDFSTVPESDMSGNYGSEWVDLDDDGIPELYMVKCSVRASEFTDPRRINQLFKVNEAGEYEDIADEVGLDFGDQSWSGNFLDMDNDGDLDGVVINHHSPHIFFRNDGGSFEKIDLGYELTSFDFQVMSADLDNNGYTDILITGAEDYVLYNQGNYNFILEEEPFGYFHVHTASIGDINNDGFLDAYGGYGKPILETGNRKDAVLINEGNDNNYVKFSLKGTNVNRSAIGAKVKLYSPLGIQQRFIQGGQSYGTVLSDILHFGMADHMAIDSIEVIWPGGLKEKFYNLQSNQHYLIEEGGCISAFANVAADNLSICPSETTTISVPDSLVSVMWSDGSTDLTRNIDVPGYYGGIAVNSNGCSVPLLPVTITAKGLDDFGLPYQDTVIICDGDPIGTDEAYSAYSWSDGSVEQDIIPLEEGSYFVTIQDQCGNAFSDEVYVEFDHTDLVNTSDTIKKDSVARIPGYGNTTRWFLNEEDEAPFFIGDTLVTTPLTGDTSFYYEVVSFPSRIASVVGIDKNEEDNPYANNNINAVMRFDALASFKLVSLEVNTDVSGNRRIIILDAGGEEVYAETFFIEPGNNLLSLDALIPAGVGYRITTEPDINMDQLGHLGPRFTRSSIDVFYPYTDHQLISIEGSENGPNYYYFYNWEVEQSGEACHSERYKVDVKVDFSESVYDPIIAGQISIYPNPAIDFIELHNNSGKEGRMMLTDLSGKVVLEQRIKDPFIKLDVGDMKAGVYGLTIMIDHGIYTHLVVIAK